MHGASLTPQATAGRELRRIIILADALLLSETEVDEFPCVLPKFPEKKVGARRENPSRKSQPVKS